MKILVPVDGSRHSQAAVAFIASRSRLIGTDPDVRLLNVQLPIPTRAARVVGKEVAKSYYEDESAKALKGALAVLSKAGLSATGEYRVGYPAEAIAEAAEALDADLVVMGSHGHGALAGLLLGSVTNGVLARSKRPLLVLRESHAARGDSLKVGIAVDGSRFGREAVKYVIRHRDLFGAEPQLQLLNVVPDFAGAVMPDMAGIALPAFSAEDVAAMQAKTFDKVMRPALKLLAKAQLAADTVRLAGNPGDELAAYAKKKRLDLLVMGSHGYGAFRQAVMGSVATRVIAHCTTPVLLVRDA